MSFRRASSVLFVVAWLLVAVALGWLAWRAPSLPEQVPIFRSPWSEGPRLAPRTIWTVLRVALMGAAQLGAVTVLAVAVVRARSAGWTRLAQAGALAVGVKTLLEAIEFGGVGTLAALALRGATIGVVGAFILFVVALWRRGALENAPRLNRSETALVVLSVAAWALLVVAPLV